MPSGLYFLAGVILLCFASAVTCFYLLCACVMLARFCKERRGAEALNDDEEVGEVGEVDGVGEVDEEVGKVDEEVGEVGKVDGDGALEMV